MSLDDPNFEHAPYDAFEAYGRSKTANILFAVEFDRRHRARGIRAAAVHPGGIQTELGRHIDAETRRQMIDRINAANAAAGRSSFSYSTMTASARTHTRSGSRRATTT